MQKTCTPTAIDMIPHEPQFVNVTVQSMVYTHLRIRDGDIIVIQPAYIGKFFIRYPLPHHAPNTEMSWLFAWSDCTSSL